MTARELALRVVGDVFPTSGESARGAHAAFDYRVRRAGLSSRDVAFAAELAYGAIKMRRTLDWYINPLLTRPLSELPAAIAEILRLAVYELVYTRADEHATLFEFVNLAKRFGHRGVGNLVNAVLRRFLRERPPVPGRELFVDEDEYLATRYSLPTWLVRQWREVFSGRLEEICRAVNAPAGPALVVNVLRATMDDAAAQLAAAGVETRRSPLVAESLLVERGQISEAAGDGRWWPQSESSAMVADVLAPQPGESILDVCSGRGNKALQIGARLAGDGTLLCVEGDPRKAATLAQRLERADVVAGIVTGDATQALLPREQHFDRVLLDAPCSGTGIVGRQPEARWKKQSTDGERLAITQRALLEQAARHVDPSGTLVYAVCSTDPRETTEVMEWFLARENFERGPVPAAYEPLLTDAGDVLVPPGIDGRDGFYIARLVPRQ
ncbi:MAG TPA: transcription antitermination factor NusB [Candidatus Cybelea sp.]|nr:transcription antitermination factor NusB [Candidatus Cybelea sp.]